VILLRVVNSDKAITDQVYLEINNLESSAQISAAQQIKPIGVIFTTTREDENKDTSIYIRMYLLDKSNCRL
jgi:hypothetical protein